MEKCPKSHPAAPNLACLTPNLYVRVFVVIEYHVQVNSETKERV